MPAGKPPIGVIIGAVVAGVAGLVLIAGAGFLWHKRRSDKGPVDVAPAEIKTTEAPSEDAWASTTLNLPSAVVLELPAGGGDAAGDGGDGQDADSRALPSATDAAELAAAGGAATDGASNQAAVHDTDIEAPPSAPAAAAAAVAAAAAAAAPDGAAADAGTKPAEQRLLVGRGLEKAGSITSSCQSMAGSSTVLVINPEDEPRSDGSRGYRRAEQALGQGAEEPSAAAEAEAEAQAGGTGGGGGSGHRGFRGFRGCSSSRRCSPQLRHLHHCRPRWARCPCRAPDLQQHQLAQEHVVA